VPGLDQRIKHPLQIEGRAADDLQNFRRGRLLFRCFLQLALAGLLGLKEARVFDGDDGLVGEGINERDLRGRIWFRLPPHKSQDANWMTVAKESD
jgi:hypothetical protein